MQQHPYFIVCVRSANIQSRKSKQWTAWMCKCWYVYFVLCNAIHSSHTHTSNGGSMDLMSSTCDLSTVILNRLIESPTSKPTSQNASMSITVNTYILCYGRCGWVSKRIFPFQLPTVRNKLNWIDYFLSILKCDWAKECYRDEKVLGNCYKER